MYSVAMAPTDYSISDVAALTGTPVRTIRYYIAEGLLPSSGKVGPAARYDDAFVARLRAIRRLQERHLPLAEIRRALAAMPDATVIAAVEPAEPVPADSAAEYVRRLLGVAEERVSYSAAPLASAIGPVTPAPDAAAPAPAPSAPPAPAARSAEVRLIASAAASPPASPPGPAADLSDAHADPAAHVPATRFTPPVGEPLHAAAPVLGWAVGIPEGARDPAPAERSHWERVAITPDIEIHIRRPLSRRSAKRAERLLEAARDIFDEGA